MKVFISWSKDKSKLTAEAFNKWLPKVIQSIEPWISQDIEKGKRWSPEINNNLESTKAGIICLNQENLNEPWILFEAGAMAKTKDAHVCTFLLDISYTDVQQPLGQFQHTKYEKEDIRKLVHTINQLLSKCGEKELKPEVLDESFNKFWDDFDKELKKIKEQNPPSTPVKRPDRELLEEILAILRNQQSAKPDNLHFINTTKDGYVTSSMVTPVVYYDSSRATVPTAYLVGEDGNRYLSSGEYIINLSEPTGMSLKTKEIKKSTEDTSTSEIKKNEGDSKKKE